LALQRAHHQQQQQLQQARASQPVGMLSNPNLNANPHASLKLGSGDRSTPSIMELDRQIASSDSGQNRNSPANSTAAGSSLQVSICEHTRAWGCFHSISPLFHGCNKALFKLS